MSISRRELFDEVAGLYARVRPGYPDALYDDLFALAAVPPGGRILEVGCGPGTASVHLARRGYALDCIEIGPKMAFIARSRLAAFPNAQVRISRFESWRTETRYDLIASASAFHWIPTKVRYPRASKLLKTGGAIAMWWNRNAKIPDDGGFFDAVRDIYASVEPGLVKTIREPDKVPRPERQGLIASGLFENVETRTYLWQQNYTAAEYVQLLNTHSDYFALSSAKRHQLFRGISHLIEEKFDGRIVKGYLTVLHVARKSAARATVG